VVDKLPDGVQDFLIHGIGEDDLPRVPVLHDKVCDIGGRFLKPVFAPVPLMGIHIPSDQIVAAEHFMDFFICHDAFSFPYELVNTARYQGALLVFHTGEIYFLDLQGTQYRNTIWKSRNKNASGHI
jgi:hypothetical protein